VAIGLTDAVRSIAPRLFVQFADWHMVLFIVGAPGVILAVLMALTMREPSRRGAVSQSTRFSLLPLWRELVTNRVALFTVMMGTIMNVMIVNAQLAWFPTLFVRVHQWEPARIALALAVVGVPFGILSAITAGSALTWLAKRGREDGPVLVMMLQCTAWALFGTAKCLAPTPELALFGHVLTSMFATWAVTSALTALNQVTPNQLRGQIVAVYTLLTGLVGIAVGSGAVGFLSDYVFNYPTGIAPSLALVCFLGGAIGIAILGLGRAGYLSAVRRAASFNST